MSQGKKNAGKGPPTSQPTLQQMWGKPGAPAGASTGFAGGFKGLSARPPSGKPAGDGASTGPRPRTAGSGFNGQSSARAANAWVPPGPAPGGSSGASRGFIRITQEPPAAETVTLSTGARGPVALDMGGDSDDDHDALEVFRAQQAVKSGGVSGRKPPSDLARLVAHPQVTSAPSVLPSHSVRAAPQSQFASAPASSARIIPQSQFASAPPKPVSSSHTVRLIPQSQFASAPPQPPPTSQSSQPSSAFKSPLVPRHPSSVSSGPVSLSNLRYRQAVQSDRDVSAPRPALPDAAPAPAPRKRKLGFDFDAIGRPAAKGSSSRSSVTTRYGDGLKKVRRSGLDAIQLSEEQQLVHDLVIHQKKSLFFTGSAGTGKSVVLKKIIRELKMSMPFDAVAVTAPTGIAAFGIEGTTIHSFAGIGLGESDVDTYVKRIKASKRNRERWHAVQVLVIDEVSMLDGTLFDKLDRIAKNVRGRSAPFGGIQLVLTGDFFQLPPVSKSAKFIFESDAWSSCITRTIQLKQVFRQKDPVFVKILNEMRVGELSDASERILKSLSRTPTYPDDGIEPTELYALRNQVEQSNQARLRSLPSQAREFRAVDYTPTEWSKSLLNNTLAPEVLHLKVNTQVMLVKNLDVTKVNGLVGKVVGWGELQKDPQTGQLVEVPEREYDRAGTLLSEKWFPRVRFINSDMDFVVKPQDFTVSLPSAKAAPPRPGAPSPQEPCRTQIPLVMAWAMSIHKAQGQTLPRVKVDLNKVFERGQVYVALSRATSLEGLQVLNFDRRKIMVHSRVGDFMKTLE